MNEVDVVMLGYGDEPYLADALAAVAASTGVRPRTVLVDNGTTRDDLDELCARTGATLLRPGRNLGFTGGVNLGLAHGEAPFVALVNSDAIVAPDALARLVAVATDPGIGIASGDVRLADDPSTMNSAGNPLHVLGLSWAGGLGDPATSHAEPRDVASCSGAGVVLRREVWEELRGFPEEFFAYQEDLELSWRTWQAGLRVRYVPDAVVVHHYAFGRHPAKMYLLERNRLLFVLTTYGGRTLAALALPLLSFEVAMLLVASLQGWGRQKLRGWWWVLRHIAWVRSRRRWVQAARRVEDRELAHLWTTRFDPAVMPLPPGSGALQGLLAGYWRAVRPLL
ncbi:glycosyl transferase family 2 [Cellulomonas flavigena DSM 20109]|uniref:Glycosyl transferase family 2 n=1 Tax=Cellulomonas flavigena (strain ATCC 482 / DSM 20109 / BCRC 11376 / JCM 18109 / NBRC 3775 / NCIMB 8073 / NRS 134) TaxID=446466 RepID=D5UHC1_CELFN|nr:glycosyltransferase family 2 protein [Cellulomonas flavigena]ADG75242.1 glycosyl transferase family 2 [Cellulomonas flavigena DSM 20109]